MRGRKAPLSLISAALVILIVSVFFISENGVLEPTAFYSRQLDARARMERCMQAVRQYREELSIPLVPEDIHKTGLIGVEFTDITTSLGAIEAKRTAADPDMAALLVRMLSDAGLKPGDRVCAGFSGSFPSLDIAVICACDAMELEICYISSVGASTWGANHPELTFPDIAHRLYSDKLISADSALVTPGGDRDNGKGVFDEDAFIPIIERIESYGITVMREEDFQKNLAARRAVYDTGDIDCFVAVGGNITSLGIGDSAVTLGQGLLKRTVSPDRLSGKTGLVEWYLAQGIPVINLLNIKKIVADYSMPFDPTVQAAAGTSPVYFRASYPKAYIAAALAVTASFLIAAHRLKKSR